MTESCDLSRPESRDATTPMRRRLKNTLRSVDQRLRALHKPFRQARVLFDIPNAFSAKAVESVVHELRQRGKHVRVTGRDQQVGTESEYLSSFPALVELFIDRSSAQWGAWDTILFTDTPSVYYRRKALRIRFPHGSGEGLGVYSWPYSLTLTKRAAVDVILCASEAHATFLTGLEPRAVLGTNLFSIGCPAVDGLAEGRFDRTSVLEGMGLPTDRKTVLLSSHWTARALLRTHGTDVLRLLAGLPGTNLIVTGHNHLWYRGSVRKALGDAWYDLLDDTAASFPNVRLVRTGDVRPLLAASDVLIGDGSSLALEYSVLDRPIVQFCHESHDPGNGLLEDLLQRTVHRFNQLDELAPLVREQLARPTLGAPGARRALVEYSYDYLGCGTTRATDVIESLTENPDFASSLAGPSPHTTRTNAWTGQRRQSST